MCELPLEAEHATIVDRIHTRILNSNDIESKPSSMPKIWQVYQDGFKGMIHRFCIAHQWNEDEVAAALVETFKWRFSMNADTLPFLPANNVRGYNESELLELYDRESLQDAAQASFSASVKLLFRNYSGTWYRWDKYGHPIYIERMGKIDCENLYQSFADVFEDPVAAVLKIHVANENELGRLLCVHQSLKLKKKVEQISVIMDLQGLGLRHMHKPAMSILQAMLQADQKYYCESLHHLYVVNAPSIFTMFWNIVRYWLNERTQNKVVILGTDFLEKLKEDIDIANIPVVLGGTCDLDLPLPTDNQTIDLAHGAMQITVGAWSSHTESLDMSAGDVACWEFATVGYNIGFSAVFKGTASHSERQVVPVEKVESHLVKEKGDFQAGEDGKLELIFDNTYSYLIPKPLVLKLWKMK